MYNQQMRDEAFADDPSPGGKVSRQVLKTRLERLYQSMTLLDRAKFTAANRAWNDIKDTEYKVHVSANIGPLNEWATSPPYPNDGALKPIQFQVIFRQFLNLDLMDNDTDCRKCRSCTVDLSGFKTAVLSRRVPVSSTNTNCELDCWKTPVRRKYCTFPRTKLISGTHAPAR